MEKIKQIEAGVFHLEKLKLRKSFRLESVNLELMINDLKYVISLYYEKEKEVQKLSKEIKKLKDKGGKTNDKTRNKN